MDGITQMIREELGVLPYIFSIVLFFFVRFVIIEVFEHSKTLGTVVGLIAAVLFIIFWAKALTYGLIALCIFVLLIIFLFVSF